MKFTAHIECRYVIAKISKLFNILKYIFVVKETYTEPT
jgi:hypothetical protein